MPPSASGPVFTVSSPSLNGAAWAIAGAGNRVKAAAAPAEADKVVCTYSKRIGDAPPPPTAETHGPVVEKKDEKRELQPA